MTPVTGESAKSQEPQEKGQKGNLEPQDTGYIVPGILGSVGVWEKIIVGFWPGPQFPGGMASGLYGGFVVCVGRRGHRGHVFQVPLHPDTRWRA